jgi:hypothetical protein
MFLKDLSSFWQVTYCFLTSLDIVVYLLLIFVNVPTFFTKIFFSISLGLLLFSFSISCPKGRMERRDEGKEETKGRRGVLLSLSLGQDIVFENKMPFT